jgi:hypothetical protein
LFSRQPNKEQSLKPLKKKKKEEEEVEGYLKKILLGQSGTYNGDA